jgi:hypothetical protein
MRIEIGDVFTVPLDDARTGLGQVVAKYQRDGYYFALFAKARPRTPPPDAEAVGADHVALLALSLDAKLWVGDWKIIGRAPVPAGLPLPAYLLTIGASDKLFVVDYTGERQRPASALEDQRLPYRTIVAPVRLEKALRALHGLEPWHPAYDDLKPNAAMAAANFFD